MGCNECCSILLAVVFPPCGVFCATGCSCDLVINVLLTVLGWIPGVLHAFYVLGITSADNEHRRRRHHNAPPARREAQSAHGNYQPLPGQSPGPLPASAAPAVGYPVASGPSTPPDLPPPSGRKDSAAPSAPLYSSKGGNGKA